MSLYVSREEIARFAGENGMYLEGDDFLQHGTGPFYRGGDLGIEVFLNDPYDPEFCEAVVKRFWGRPIPAVQLRAAQALARAYNHAWGFVDLDTLPELTQAAIWKACQNQERSMAGIDAPDVDEVGTITHVTGSGRLMWEVDPDGSTMLNIYRPDVEHAVLTVALRNEGDVYEESQMEVWYDASTPYHWRHVVAIEEASRVVNTHLKCVSELVFEKNMATLAARAKPDADGPELADIFYLLRHNYGGAAVSLMKARLDWDGTWFCLDGRGVFKVTDNLIQFGYGRFQDEWKY